MSVLRDATAAALSIPPISLGKAEQALAESIRAVAHDRFADLEASFSLGDGAELRPIFDALCEEGILKLNLPVRLGGELDAPLPTALQLCLIRESLARFSSVADEIYVAHNLGLYPVMRWGTSNECVAAAEQGCNGGMIFGYALTERGAGSDPSGVRTTVRRSGDGWRLSGEKRFISNAPGADAYVVFAKVEGTEEQRSSHGMCAFLVLRTDPGFQMGAHLQMTAPHPIGEISFDEVPLSQGRLLGEPGDGMMIALQTLHIFRVSVAAQAVGWIQRACDLAQRRSLERHTFGRPLADHYGIRRKLAGMGRDVLAGRALVRVAASLADGNGSADTGLSSSVAKAFVTEAAFRAAFEAQQIWGAEGLVVGHPAQALLRETRQAITYEGPSEIQRKIIARRLGVDV